jgi:flagellar biosynthesis/type III secretory pathway chaperone
MTNKELFKQAIAEAKTIREAALVNAKAALEETLTPHLQSMLASKLEEMAKDDEDVKEEIEEVAPSYGENMEEELNLDEFLAELELEEGSDEEIDEVTGASSGYDPSNAAGAGLENIINGIKSLIKKGGPMAKKAYAELEKLGAAAASGMREGKEETEEEMEDETSEEETSVADLSIEDLKDIIKDIVDSELGAEGAEDEEEMMDGDAVEMDSTEEPEMSEDEINLEELLAELDALDTNEADEDAVYEAKKAKKDEKELDEAVATIKTLRTELNEVNLLNAKLLYVNKIFKAKNLSEDNKIKVINAFDKATTPNEAKLVFEALNESLEAKETSKSMVKEGIIKGFASKPAGNAPSKQIVETNEQISRFQKLAGITKY